LTLKNPWDGKIEEEDEDSTPLTPSSPNHDTKVEVRLSLGNEDNIQVFLIEMTTKQISIPKGLRCSWPGTEGFETLLQQLKHQKLKTFLVLLRKIYPDPVKVFFTNFQFKNYALLSSVKGVQMEISKKTWKDNLRLSQRGVQVRKGKTGVVEEFNKMQYYGQCWRNPSTEIKTFYVGGLKVDERLLAMIITKVIIPVEAITLP